MMTQQQYLLACLSEELCEVGQEIGKCQRFTPHHRPPEYPLTNIQRVKLELADVKAILELLREVGLDLLDEDSDFLARVADKKSRTVKIRRVSEELGVVLASTNN